jgi:Flp pilus assembly protein TadG
MRARQRDDRGVTAVEFVLVTPVLIVAMLFTVGLGRMAHARHQVEAAAADAARAASLERNTTLAANRGEAMAADVIGARGVSCAKLHVVIDVSSYEPGGAVRADVTCEASLSDVAFAGFPGRRTFAASATVPIESFRSN